MGIGEYKYKAYGTSNYPEKQQEAERVWEGTRGSIDGLVKILEIEPADSEKHKEALNAMHGYITTNFVITFWSVNEDGNEKYDTLLDDKGLNKYAISQLKALKLRIPQEILDRYEKLPERR